MRTPRAALALWRLRGNARGDALGVMLAAALAAAGALGTACQPTTAAPDTKPAECITCHMPEYRATTHPMHVDVRPTACEVCHTQEGWSPSVLQHEWPLTGAHLKADCFGCHTGSPRVFHGTPKTCVGCHRADFDKSDFPGHASFPTTCADCHTTTAWKPASRVAHASTSPAPAASAGTHPVASASAAHAAASATHAPHAPTAPTSTAPATPATTPTPATPAPTPAPAPAAPTPAHPESAFPIKSGNHASIDCQQCHSLGGANSKANTSCVHCHARSKYDGIHSRVGSYPQGAAAANFCVGCHSRGTRSRN